MNFTSERLLQILERFPSATGYRVAYSGGLDSSVLLHALAALRDRLPAPLSALHLDHGLQASAPDWARHCADTCRAWGVPLVTRRLMLRPVAGASLEAEARTARRAAFRAELSPGELLLTAQHRDDQAETLLLQLLRGAGLAGLAAMPDLALLGAGRLGRPLLGFGRAELQDYARRHGIAWVDDPSNADTRFDRNYLRHRVLPLLAERWPAQARTLSRSARHCARAQDLIAELAEHRLAGVRGSRPGTLGVSALVALDTALARVLVRRWIREQGHVLPSSERVERILREVLAAAPDRSPLVAWDGAQVRRFRDDLFLLPPLPDPPTGLELAWNGVGECPLPAGLGRLRTEPWPGPGLDPAGREGRRLHIRFAVTGLRCRLPGAPHRRRLKQLYQARGVPDWVRPYVPLVLRDERLVAVAGVAQCEPEVDCGGMRVVWEGHPFGGLLPECRDAAMGVGSRSI